MPKIGLDTSVAFPLPLAREEITAGWLTRALRVRHPGVTVVDLRLEDVYRGASGTFRAFVEYDRAGTVAGLPETLMIKGGFQPHSKFLAGINRAEASFYGLLQHRITMRCPKCYYAGSDLAGWQSVIVMEDLDRRGVRWLRYDSSRAGFNDTAARMRALARFHSETWESLDFRPGGELDWVQPRFGGYLQAYVDATFEESFWNEKMKSPQGAACSRKLHDRDLIRRSIYKLQERDESAPNCLLHGDCHLSNTYIDGDGTPGFVDQSPCRSHWSIEVAYSLCSTLDVSDRPGWERPLIAVYLEALQSHGIEVPSFDDAYNSYASSIAYGYWGFVTNATDYQSPSVNTTGAARFASAAIHNDTYERLG